MASTYLTRTNSTSGDRQIFTVSAWVKLSVATSGGCIFSTGTAASDTGAFRILHVGGSNIQIRSGATVFRTTSAVYRDTSAWYHIVVAQDSTQATADDRLKLYVNGSQVTDFSANNAVPLNLNGPVNESGKIHTIGVRSDNNTDYWNGYMAHVHLCDGTAYDADTFGQTDSTTGIWKPKLSPSVTYGTNGFFLKFASSGSMGTDSSGNGNNFTVGAGNLTQTQDTPSNVFCTLNPLSVATNHTLTNANLTSTNSSSNQGGVSGTLNYPTSGKWYHEVKINAEDSSKGQGVGIGDNVYRSDWGTYSNFVGYLSDGTITAQGDAGYSSYGTAQNVGDIVGVAYNADDQELTFYLNGTSQGVIATSSMDGTIDFDNLCPLAFGRNMGQSFNFGNGYFGTTAVSSANSDANGYGLFEYSVPSGYYALCTKNIKEFG